MRGCAGSSVADSSDTCRSRRTRCCTRFWMSGDFCTSGSDSELPARTISRTDAARASASLRAAWARDSSAVRSPSCCWLSPVSLGPPLKMLAWPRKRSISAFGRRHLLRELVDLRLQRLLHLVGPGGVAGGEQRAIGLGDLVRDLRGELRVLRREADADEAALLGRVDVEPVEVGLHHAVLLALAGARREVERAHDAIEQRGRRQRAVELRPVGEPLVGR